MPFSRRKMLALAGGGAILAAAGGAAAFALTRTPHRAQAPWAAAGGPAYAEKRRRALSWAILAPNPHNRQPWIADLPGEDGIEIFLDPARLLPATDPFNRQITIGLGCFLELLALAAGADGHTADIAPFPEGDAPAFAGRTPAARITLRPGGAADPLFAHAATRRSAKEPFDMARPVAPEAMATALSAVRRLRAGASADPAQVAPLRALLLAAFETEMRTVPAYLESVDVMRLGRAEIEANPDGIDLGGPFLEGLMFAGLLTRDGLREVGGTMWQQGLDANLATYRETPAFVWLCSPANTREDQIAAGRDWLRLNLATTGLGLSLHPVSQALQEYPEMAGHYRTAHALLARQGETVQMLGRLGYREPVPPAPRWPIEAKIRHG